MLICSSQRPLGSHPGNYPESVSIFVHYYRVIRAALAMRARPAFSMAKVPMRPDFSRSRMLAWGVSFALAGAAATAGANGLSDLLNQKDLTPDGLARVVADFAFEIGPNLVAPETFLERKRGDCADYSNLASTVLTHHGYTTKLVVVMMARQTHVVCYVKEAGGFLDYNHRADANPVIASDGSLEDIAGKVAGDFRSDWQMASAFRYRDGSPVYLENVFGTSSSKIRKVTPNRAAEARPAKTAEGLTASPGIQAVIN
jgi:hypothetical protein